MNLDLNDLPGEIWKDIPNFVGYYKVSNMARVKSLKRIDCHNQPRPEKILKLYINPLSGNPVANLSKNGKSRPHKVSRLVATAFVENPNNHYQVNHKNDVKTDNIPTNLYWGTQKQNIKDGIRNGTIKVSGEDNNLAKLTNTQVKEIRRLHSSNLLSPVEIAKQFNISSRSTIYSILNNKTWAHI